jgi:hypothetical protein
MNDDNGKPTLSPTSLTVADAARLLTKVGGQPVIIAMLEADLAAGAPANADGTINLVHYAAWLAREMSARD